MDSYNGPYINFFRAGDTPSHIFRTPALFRALSAPRMAQDGRGHLDGEPASRRSALGKDVDEDGGAFVSSYAKTGSTGGSQTTSAPVVTSGAQERSTQRRRD